MMTALTGEDLLAWLDSTTSRWMDLVEAHPQALTLPCDIAGVKSVGEMLQHIVAVELRYAERLSDQSATDYEKIPYDSAESLRFTHQRALEVLRPMLTRNDAFWAGEIVFNTRSLGPMQAPRRVVLVHLAMHAVRHYAQLATLVRQHGIQPCWQMDYLFQQGWVLAPQQ